MYKVIIFRRDREFLSASLESEKAEGETRRKKSLALMDQLKVSPIMFNFTYKALLINDSYSNDKCND